MKAYEEWAEQNSYDRTETKKAWREALKWFYKVAEHLSPTDCDILDEELDDEAKKM